MEDYGKEYYGYLESIFLHHVPGIDEKGFKILEAGCGTGALGKFLLRMNGGFKVTGVDITPEMVRMANANRTPGYRAIVGDLEDEKLFRKDSFDIIVCPFILHRFPALDRVFENFRLWLKDGGTMILLEPNGSNPVNRISQTVRLLLESAFGKRFSSENKLATPNETAHTVKTYLRHLKRRGYRAMFVDTEHFRLTDPSNLSFGRRILYEIKNGMYVFFRILPMRTMRGSRLVIVAENDK